MTSDLPEITLNVLHKMSAKDLQSMSSAKVVVRAIAHHEKLVVIIPWDQYLELIKRTTNEK